MTEKLAHFTKIDTLFCHILPEKRLRASNVIEMNDPLENKWQWLNFVSYRHNTIAPDAITPEAENEYYNFYSSNSVTLGRHINIACFSSYNHYLIERMQFSPPHENLKMWSQYGDNHQGACIIFNRERLLSNIRNSSLNFLVNRDVSYTNTMNLTPNFLTHTISDWNKENESIDSFFHRNTADKIRQNPVTLLQKRIDWRDELEERFIFYEKDATHTFFSIENAIDEILFGVHTQQEYINSIREKHPDLKLSKMKINRANRIKIEEI